MIKPAPPSDPVEALKACHLRIRNFLAGMERLCALESLEDPRVPEAAQLAYRYFSIGLPLHARDEDESLAPRVLAKLPESRELLLTLEQEHKEIIGWLEELLPLLAELGEGRLVEKAALVEASEGLKGVLLPHIEREEQEFFGLCASLSEDEKLAFGEEFLKRRA
jgi:hemerythrin-like domain-containing protein